MRNQQNSRMKNRMFLIKAGHYICTLLLFYGAWLLFRYNEFPQVRETGYRYNYFVEIAFGIVVAFFFRIYNAYLFGYFRIRTLMLAQFISQFFTVWIIYFGVSIGWNKFKNPLYFVLLLVVYVFLNAPFSYKGNGFYFKLNPPRKTILIYRNERDRRRFGAITGKPMERLYRIEKELQFDGPFSEISDELSHYDAVFVAGVNSRCRNGILKYCEINDIRGFFLPHVGDVIMQGTQHIQAFDSPVLMATRKTVKPEYRIMKRIIDFVVSLAGLIVLSPVMLVTAIAIKLYDHGPAFYKQVRLTKDAKEFKIIKFRSMRTDAEKDGVARLSTGNKDDRITPVGRIIRRYRLDEIPQLINVLRGEMSLVGPRPERPEIAEQYYQTMPDFRLRLQVKAGITGYAQVYGRYNTEPYEKLEFDLMYINSMNLLIDIELFFATLSTLFTPGSTEGIKEGATTAMDCEDKPYCIENETETIANRMD